MPINSDPYYYTRDLATIQSQRAAVGSGTQFSPEEISSLVGANFAVQQQNEVTQERIALAKRGQDLAENQANEQQHQAAVTARRAGIYGTAQLALNAPLAYIAGKAILGPAAATEGAITGAGGVTAGTGAVAGGTELAAGGGEVAAGFGASGVAGATAEEGVTGAGAGAGSMVAPVAGAAAALGVSAAATNWAAREMGWSPQSAKTWGAAGVIAPVLTAPLVGVAVVKDIVDSIGHPHIGGVSVICTELGRQGLIDKKMLRYSSLHITKHWHDPKNREFYMGYLVFAAPVVKKMKESRLFTWLMRPYGTLLCRELASRESVWYRSTALSRFVFSVSCDVFRKIYDRSQKKSLLIWANLP